MMTTSRGDTLAVGTYVSRARAVDRQSDRSHGDADYQREDILNYVINIGGVQLV
jgi:hypothetical protein